MRVAFINPTFDPQLKTPEQLIERYSHLFDLARAVKIIGHDVNVVQVFGHAAARIADTVPVKFVPPMPVRAVNSADRAASDGSQPVEGDISRAIVAVLDELKPQAVHFNGITFARELNAVGRWCRARDLPLSASYHGGNPPRHPIRRWRQWQALRPLRHVLFPCRQQAETWSPLLPRETLCPVILAPEVSTSLRHLDRDETRRNTGITGNPVIVCSGRLHPIKDPITSIKGFARVLKVWPETRLYLCYLTDGLLGDLRKLCKRDRQLNRAVTFMGRLPHGDMEGFFNSGDIFLQASLREVSGGSLVEALAAGLVPVVTDLPPFLALTENGGVGHHFPCGDDRELAALVLAGGRDNWVQKSTAMRRHFDKALSFPVLARHYDRALRGPAADH